MLRPRTEFLSDTELAVANSHTEKEIKMATFNLASAAVTLVLILIVAAAVRSVIRQAKNGGCGCGCGDSCSCCTPSGKDKEVSK